MSGGLLTELHGEGGISTLPELLRRLRDEVAAHNFAVNRGQSRMLSLVVAKLEEAEGLAIIDGRETGRLAVIDKAKLIAGITPDATDRTDAKEVSNV